MLRGKQWLIVGDGKQVSPSESFLSETQIDSLKAVLPESPFKESLLPGRSFFDLCAQAFPRGRVSIDIGDLRFPNGVCSISVANNTALHFLLPRLSCVSTFVVPPRSLVFQIRSFTTDSSFHSGYQRIRKD
jgi:hypothetical protein